MRKVLGMAAAFAPMLPTATATAQDAEAKVVQRHVDAYRAKDMNAFLRTFASDAVVIYEGMRFQGHAEIRKIYALNFAPDAPKVLIHSSGGEPGLVWIQTGYLLGNGQQICCSVSEYTVKGGKITHLNVSGPR